MSQKLLTLRKTGKTIFGQRPPRLEAALDVLDSTQADRDAGDLAAVKRKFDTALATRLIQKQLRVRRFGIDVENLLKVFVSLTHRCFRVAELDPAIGHKHGRRRIKIGLDGRHHSTFAQHLQILRAADHFIGEADSVAHLGVMAIVSDLQARCLFGTIGGDARFYPTPSNSVFTRQAMPRHPTTRAGDGEGSGDGGRRQNWLRGHQRSFGLSDRLNRCRGSWLVKVHGDSERGDGRCCGQRLHCHAK